MMLRGMFLLFLLWQTSVLAQDGERYLKASASTLALNSTAPPSYVNARKRSPRPQDTSAVSGLTYRFRAMNYVWKQDYEKAAVWLEKTADRFPKERGAVGELYLFLLSDPARALQHLNAFDALTPNFDDYVNNKPVSYLRGLVYRRLGNHEKALEQFTKAIDPLENKHGVEWVNYRHYISRAISYTATGQLDKALSDLDKAGRTFPRSALVHYHRGKALQQAGRVADARIAFQDASFFYKALRVERSNPQEDEFNELTETEIEEALNSLPINRK